MRVSLCLGALLAPIVATAALAQGPVDFDARRVFSCSEVKPPQQADTSRKVVVAVIPISANFNVEEKTVESLRYEFQFPKTLTVLDHLPKTQTGTNIVGAQREERQERQLTDLNVRFGGEGRVGFSLLGANVNVGGGAEKAQRDVNEVQTTVQVDRLPARNQVVVAGTRDEGQTLYFDLKWFDQTTREGLTDFAILAEVPKDWTGDVVALSCAARQDGAVVTQMSKAIGLYLSGDSAARQRVEQKMMEAPTPNTMQAPPDVLTTSIGMKLKRIPAGSFLMGAAPEETEMNGVVLATDARPQHRVTISRPFFIGVYEVTQAEYRQIMGNNPSEFQDSVQQPVEQVSWYDAVMFCNKLSERESRQPYYNIQGEAVTVLGGNGFRLPTEAEWEYACRAGSTTKYSYGDNEADLGNYAWFDENSGQRTHQVGQKRPNRWGLYDMLGNVWEWCQDGFDKDYYGKSPPVDPPGPEEAPKRVNRGGSWQCFAWCTRPATRGWPYDLRAMGFRVAASVPR